VETPGTAPFSCAAGFGEPPADAPYWAQAIDHALPKLRNRARVMAEIPSDIASSAAGAPIQSREVTRAKEASRAAQSHATERQVRSLDEADATVDTDDADTQIFSDSEGGGSLGRDLSGDESARGSEEQRASPGISTDEDGQTHLDLQA